MFHLYITPLKFKGAKSIGEYGIQTAIGHREKEGEDMELQWVPVKRATPRDLFRQNVQLGGTITQHPEKQGFERGVTAAGFPTQEQMTGLGFRQGAASYKPQKYALGDEVTQQEELPPQQWR